MEVGGIEGRSRDAVAYGMALNPSMLLSLQEEMNWGWGEVQSSDISLLCPQSL